MTDAIAVASPKPISRTRQLTVEELKTIDFQMQIKGDSIIIERSAIGYKLRQPVILNLDKVLAAREKGLIAYIFKAFASDRPALIPYVFDNQSLLKMARHFLRHCSGSFHSCCLYTVNMHKYAVWLGHSPDIIIQDLKPVGAIPDPLRIQNHQGYLNDYLAELQDEGRSGQQLHKSSQNILQSKRS
jgi:hypothetical protein